LKQEGLMIYSYEDCYNKKTMVVTIS